MRVLRAGLLLGILVLGGALWAPRAGAAPRTSLALSNVTLHEALLRIRGQLGWDLRGPSGEGTDFYEQADNAPRSTFAWKNATLGKICRDLGETFKCVPQYGLQGVIQFEAQPDGGGKPLVSTTRESFAFNVSSISGVRSMEPGTPKPRTRHSAQLKLSIHPFDSDLDPLYALDKLQGVDNLGRAVRWDRKEPLRPQPLSSGGSGRPDEWQIQATLPDVDPRATRLTRLEGELVLFRDVQSYRIEVPLQGASLPLTKTAGPVEITVAQIQQATPTSLQIRYEVAWPSELEITTAQHGNPSFPYAAVRLASGRIVRSGGSAMMSPRDIRRRVVLTCVHEGSGVDPPMAVVWDLAVKAQPDRRIAFRLENVPLPFGGGGTAAPAPKPGGNSAPAPPLSRTGTLSSPVIINLEPAGEGELSIGLSLKKPGGGWDAVRWKVAPTDEDGTANLDGVAPGTYRVIRRFRERAPDGTLQPPGGKWENEAVVVRVEAGKTVTLPPFRQRP